MRELVYHYCSIDTFLKIIKNKELWMTDVTKSNDSKELQIASDRLNEVLDRRKARCDPNGSDTMLLNEFKKALKTLENFDKFFHVCCFSTKRDSLSQWAMYADDAKGIAIGFDKDSLNSITIVDENMDFRKVIYNLGEIDETINNGLNILLDKYNDIKEINDSILEDFVKFVLDEVFKKAYFYKNEGFMEESEYRLVYNSKPYSSYKEQDESPAFEQIFEKNKVKVTPFDTLGEIDFYVSKGKLISYRPLRALYLHWFIDDIVIGPKSAVNCEDIKLLLQVNKAPVSRINIEKSKITYQ